MSDTPRLRLKLLIEYPNGNLDTVGIALNERDAQVKLVTRMAEIASIDGYPVVGYTGIIIDLDTRVVRTLKYDVRASTVPIDTSEYHKYITWTPDPNKTKVFCSCCGSSFYTKEPNYMRPILCERHREKGARYTVVDEKGAETPII